MHHCDTTVIQLYRVDDDGREQARPLVHVHDLTASRAESQRILEQEQRFHRLFECATVAMLVDDLDGLVLDVNPAWCQLMRLDPAEVLGTT